MRSALATCALLGAGCLAAKPTPVPDVFFVQMHDGVADADFEALLAKCNEHHVVGAGREVDVLQAQRREARPLAHDGKKRKYRAAVCHVKPAVAVELKQMRGVKRVTQEMVYPPEEASPLACPNAQYGAEWGQRFTTAGPGSGGQGLPFRHDPNWGAGVDVYVMDSGIRCSHEQFGGRCIHGWSCETRLTFEGYVPYFNDDHGHGTHVAGIVGASGLGIAKSATIINVKIMKSSGTTTEWTVAGFQWVSQEVKRRGRPAIVTRSMGGNVDMDDAAQAFLFDEGIQMTSSAGNDGADCNTCDRGPVALEDGIAVGSIGAYGVEDTISGFSCRGPCIDIFAPGYRILSLSNWGDSQLRTTSGTSQATPAVAGAIAAFLTYNPNASAQEMRNWVVDNALDMDLRGDGIQGHPNKVLHIPCGGVAPPLPTPTSTPTTTTSAPATTVPPQATSTTTTTTTTTTTAPPQTTTAPPLQTTTTTTPLPAGNVGCSGEVVMETFGSIFKTGTIDHPAGASSYANDEAKCWLLRCPSTVVLRFAAFALEDRYDYLRVRSAGGVDAFTGATLPPDVVVDGDVALDFTSDRSVTRSGFVVSWQCGDAEQTSAPTTTTAPSTAASTTIAPSPTTTAAPATTVAPTTAPPTARHCPANRQLLDSAEGSGVIDFPAGDFVEYDLSDEWCWTLRCAGGRVEVAWELFDVERNWDFVYAYEADGTVTALTGYSLPTKTSFVGTTTFRLVSDSSQSYDGFVLAWQCVA